MTTIAPGFVLWRSRAGTAAWERPALLGLLALTALLYLWDLGASGWANSFYSAAAQAGASDWTAFFYGSSDAANSITVDKPPASLWVMALSVRLFGLSSWSILVPQALMGVATVGLVYATVRRHFSARVALLAGGMLALTPVAVLMFRFNNPDALLVLLLALAVYLTVRGIDSGAIRWVIWAGVAVGFAFLTKQLQAFLILPVLAGVYLWAAPMAFGKRMLHALAALGAVILSAGWWVAVVELTPATLRPYIGGSQTNSFLELTFGYNGLGRLTGDETGSVTGGVAQAAGGGAGMWGDTGLLRLFSGEIGGQISWLLPAAIVLFALALVFLRRAKRTDARRTVLMLFGGWLIVTALAFSFMAGIFHAYYTVALAPPLAAVVAIGAAMLWKRRARLWARITSAVLVLGTASLAYGLLVLSESWMPWLRFAILGLAGVAAVLLLLPPRGRVLSAATVAITLVGALLAPAAYSFETVTVGQTGSIPTAGPTVNTSSGFGGAPLGRTTHILQNGLPGGFPAVTGTLGPPPPGRQPLSQAHLGALSALGGMGGLLGTSTVTDEVRALLDADAGDYRWVAAAIGSNNAAGYQLATEHAVMPVGGFNGSDPSPTLEQFQRWVAAGDIHYFIAGEIGRPNGGSNVSEAIQTWVEDHFTAIKLDGLTVYDLTM